MANMVDTIDAFYTDNMLKNITVVLHKTTNISSDLIAIIVNNYLDDQLRCIKCGLADNFNYCNNCEDVFCMDCDPLQDLYETCNCEKCWECHSSCSTTGYSNQQSHDYCQSCYHIVREFDIDEKLEVLYRYQEKSLDEFGYTQIDEYDDFTHSQTLNYDDFVTTQEEDLDEFIDEQQEDLDEFRQTHEISLEEFEESQYDELSKLEESQDEELQEFKNNQTTELDKFAKEQEEYLEAFNNDQRNELIEFNNEQEREFDNFRAKQDRELIELTNYINE